MCIRDRKNDRFFEERKVTFTPKIAAALLKSGKVNVKKLYSPTTGKNYGELHITEYQSSIEGLAGKLTELESLDELNYLSELLKMQFDDDREKFVAAMEDGLSLIHI